MRWTVAIVAVSFCLALSGCVTQQQREYQQAVLNAATPVCHNDKQCEVMWGAVRTWVMSNCAMRIQNITNDFIQTYPSPHGSPMIACTASKQAGPNGDYGIVANFSCGNIFGCMPDVNAALLNFSSYVSQAGVSLAPAQPLPNALSPEAQVPDARVPNSHM